MLIYLKPFSSYDGHRIYITLELNCAATKIIRNTTNKNFIKTCYVL